MSQSSDAAAAIAATVAPALKATGFRKRGRLFNRRLPGGVVHAIQLELQPSWSSGEGHGQFEFGVYLTRMPGGTDSQWVSAPRSHLRAFAHDFSPEKVWPDDFRMGSDAAAEWLARVVLDDGLAWLNRFSDENSTLDEIESMTPGYGRGAVFHKPLIELYLLRDERERATEIVRYLTGKPLSPGAYDNFHSFFVENGWQELADTMPNLTMEEWGRLRQAERKGLNTYRDPTAGDDAAG